MDLNNNYHKQSAVIVLHERSTDSLILTKRSDHLRQHPGEICFPGGRWDVSDPSLYATALRELKEELGIESKRVTFKKKLLIEKTLLGSIIHPWFATIDSIEPAMLNLNEVTKIVRVPIERVNLIENYKEIMLERGGRHFLSCEFTGSSEYIWGATARIMKQFCIK